MKFTLALWLSLCVGSLAFAQQRPLHSQYIANFSLLNPAISGIDDYMDIKINYRNQWTGVEDAPQTFYATANTHLNKRDRENYVGGIPLPNSKTNQRTFRPKKYYKGHHAVGLVTLYDSYGAFSTFNLEGAYAYHQPLREKLKISFGFTFGFIQGEMNLDDVRRRDEEIGGIGGGSYFQPNATAGIALYNDKYITGISAHQIAGQRIETAPSGLGDIVPHYYWFGAYRFYNSLYFSLSGLSVMRLVPEAPLSFDLNVKMEFQKKAWIGAGYRRNDAIVLFTGYNFKDFGMIGYSYDYNLSEISAFGNNNGGSTGSHEIFIGFNIKNKRGIICPENLW